jgi:hypothetical protein
MEDGRLGRPCGPGALSHAISENPLYGYAAILTFLPDGRQTVRPNALSVWLDWKAEWTAEEVAKRLRIVM